MAVQPRFQVVVGQIDPSYTLATKLEMTVGGHHAVVESDDGLAFLYILQIVLQPLADVFRCEVGSPVASLHRSDDIVYIAHFKGVVRRSEELLEALLSIRATA